MPPITMLINAYFTEASESWPSTYRDNSIILNKNLLLRLPVATMEVPLSDLPSRGPAGCLTSFKLSTFVPATASLPGHVPWAAPSQGGKMAGALDPSHCCGRAALTGSFGSESPQQPTKTHPGLHRDLRFTFSSLLSQMSDLNQAELSPSGLLLPPFLLHRHFPK